MSDANIAQLVSLANISEQQARQLLEVSGGDLNAALELALDQAPAAPAAPVAKPSTQQQQKPPQPQAQPRRGVTGLSDLGTKPEEGAPNKDNKDLNWYTGGASSGIQVEAPKQKPPPDIVKNVFDQAVKHGAIAKHDEKAQEKDKFVGSGFVLGNTERQSAVVPGMAPKPVPKRVVLTFYKDCFTIDDGPPRKLTDPANKSFIDDVNNGVIPRELAAGAQAGVPGELDVELVDKKTEEYKPPPSKPVAAFSGSGHTLGGPDAGMPSGLNVRAGKLVVDSNAPTTSIQVRTHNGQRLIVKANHTHTVGQLKAHIEAECPAGKPFELRTTYPPQALTNDSQTVKDAGLLNAAIVQKI